MKSCCGNNGTGNNQKNNAQEKENGRNRDYLSLKLVMAIFLVVVAVAATLYLQNTGRLSSVDTQGEAQAAVTPVTSGQDVTFPESTFADGKAKFFEYKTPEGKTVRYFVIKSSDGVIRAAFDACDVCFEAGKGYFQKDDFMVCRNCGRRFQSTKVNVVTGGCNPSALTRTIRDGKVVIPVQALNEGRKLFN
jgi:uncharacterized membrane protein